MCGFVGELITGGSGGVDAALIRTLAERLAHRGPDQRGEWFSPDGRCGIGFHRLAVIDLPGSLQPMCSGPAVVAFNGEIYNFRELRGELAGYPFRTQGDTEVLLALWHEQVAHMPRAEPGPAAQPQHALQEAAVNMLGKLGGMFAFALYDQSAGVLLLARDRLGQKPLWYATLDDRIIFASEAKALLGHPRLGPAIDPSAVPYYLTFGYVPAPRSIWRNVHKLPPGHFLLLRVPRRPLSAAVQPHPGEDGGRPEWRMEGAEPSPGKSAPRRYWSLPERTRRLGLSEAAEMVREQLSSAVRRQMVADVPLGVLLSGGIDSSIVAALMCREAGQAGGVRTFTAGFAEGGFDERGFAAGVARHLGTQHQELAVAPPNAADLLDRLVRQYDEPFADSSALPLYLVCQAARRHVTVALTGDGGDEVFGGYDRYRAMRLAETLHPMAYLGVKAAAWLGGLLAPHDERNRLRRLVRFASALEDVPSVRYLAYRRLFDPAALRDLLERRFVEVMPPQPPLGDDPLEAPGEWFCRLYEGGERADDPEYEGGEFADETAFAQRCDLLSYLPDDLLVKSDIASMAHGLELRSPMLEHDVVELGLALPAELRVAGGRWGGGFGKVILRQAFADLVPAEVFARPKRGFGVPLDQWLRGPLLPLLRRTLLEGALVGQDWLCRPALQRLIDQHVAGRCDHRHRLWALLWLGRWLEIGGG